MMVIIQLVIARKLERLHRAFDILHARNLGARVVARENAGFNARVVVGRAVVQTVQRNAALSTDHRAQIR